VPSQVERDVDDELEFHLAMRRAELERSGLSADAAAREALRAFGDLAATRHELARSGHKGERQARWRSACEDLWRDVRYGARSLVRSPGFTAVAALVLAVGIGANSAAFSLVNVLLMRPVLVTNPDEIVAVFARSEDPSGERMWSWSGFSYTEYADLRDGNRTFADLAAFAPRDIGIADGGITRRVRADFVSANYFRTLGIGVATGREFTAAEERRGGDGSVAIVSHDLWVRRGRDPQMLGSVLQINGEPVAVVGIAAEGFTGHNPVAPDLWLPLGLVERFGGAGVFAEPGSERAAPPLLMPTLFGRIAAGTSRSEVETDLEGLATRQPPASDGRQPGYVVADLPRFSSGNAPDGDDDRLFVAMLASVLTGLSGVVLLIACINLANMFLARGAGRRTEIAIRQALGGGRLRLVRQLLVEGFLLALVGGTAGLLLAYWAVRGLVSSIPTTVAIGSLASATLDVRPDAFVLGATLASCLVATLLFGLGPAWKISGDVAGTLKEISGGRAAAGPGKLRTPFAPRSLLIIAQTALSLALLTAGGLFLRGTVEAGNATPGFALEPIALAEIDPSLAGYDEPRSREVFRQSLERARALPGVESVSLSSLVPFGTMSIIMPVQVVAGQSDDLSRAHYYVVTEDYFRTLALPVLAGRAFTHAEASFEGGNPVVIIDEPLAQRLFGGTGQALGRFIEFPSVLPGMAAPAVEIVGVVPGTRHRMTDAEPSPHVYLPFGQVPSARRFDSTMHLHARAAANVDAETLLEPLRNELAGIDSTLPVLSLKTMVDHRNNGVFMWGVRTASRIFSMLGGLALFLAIVGAYGVNAFVVARRTREIGVRMALGAAPADVMRQMLHESLGLTVAGLGVGVLLAVAVARLVSALLYGVQPIDPLVLIGSATVLGVALLLAAYLPTRRATRIDPTTALRHE
jgi:predicted permease